MLRRIILMRHAKSSWKSDAPTDHARPLNGRGRRDAPRVGAQLRELGWVPDAVWSSDSERTRETFARMRESLGFSGEPHFEPALYHGGVEEIVEALGQLDDAVGTVMLLGHNPGWEEALHWLSGHDELLTTANAALLERELAHWAEGVGEGGWRLEMILRPREL